MSESGKGHIDRKDAGGEVSEVSYGEAFAYVLFSIGATETPISQTQVFSALPKAVNRAVGKRFPQTFYEARGSDLEYIFLDNEVVDRGLAEWVPGLGITLTESGQNLLEIHLEQRDENPQHLALIPDVLNSIADEQNQLNALRNPLLNR